MVFGGGPVATRSAADFRMMRETLGLSQAWVARMVGVSTLTVAHWEDQLKGLIRRHAVETGSRKAAGILQHWEPEKSNFLQICPKEMLVHLPYPLGIEESAVRA